MPDSADEECFYRESLRAIPVERQKLLPVEHKGVRLDCGSRLDLVTENPVALHTKAVESLEPIHEAQVLICLGLGGWTVGLPINVNVPVLKGGVERTVNNWWKTVRSLRPRRTCT